MVRRRDDMIFAGRPPGTGVWGLDILILEDNKLSVSNS